MSSDVEARSEGAASVPLRAFGFNDIHPLWGGRAMWATDDLTAEVRVVDRTQCEERYLLLLSVDEWTEVEVLVAASGLLDAAPSGRMGAPDEALPTITLVLANGETKIQAKWANDRKSAFDQIYAHLAAILERVLAARNEADRHGSGR